MCYFYFGGFMHIRQEEYTFAYVEEKVLTYALLDDIMDISFLFYPIFVII